MNTFMKILATVSQFCCSPAEQPVQPVEPIRSIGNRINDIYIPRELDDRDRALIATLLNLSGHRWIDVFHPGKDGQLSVEIEHNHTLIYQKKDSIISINGTCEFLFFTRRSQPKNHFLKDILIGVYLTPEAREYIRDTDHNNLLRYLQQGLDHKTLFEFDLKLEPDDKRLYARLCHLQMSIIIVKIERLISAGEISHDKACELRKSLLDLSADISFFYF